MNLLKNIALVALKVLVAFAVVQLKMLLFQIFTPVLLLRSAVYFQSSAPGRFGCVLKMTGAL